MRRLLFQPAPYHGAVGTAMKSRGPTLGQSVLDSSMQVKLTSPRRLGVDYVNKEIVIFDQTSSGVFHGHVRTWGELVPEQQSLLRQWFDIGSRGQFPPLP